MDNVTVIVDNTIQDVTVQVVTTGITVDQANQIVANTQKVSDINHVTLELFNVVNLDTTNASNITTGTLPSSVLPPVAITTVQVAVSEVAMLALTTEEGDVVVRSDENKSYMKNDGVVGDMTDFTELQTPTDSVLSVNGQTGAVVLTTTNVNEGTNLYYTDVRVDANSSVTANTAKVGITPTQASDIVTNNAKITYPSVDSTKVGFISVTQAVDLDTIESDTTVNNAKISFDTISSTRLANTSGTNTGDQDLSGKVDKVAGYSLTKNDLTDILKTAYDNAVTWITTNGTNLLNHLTNTTNPHSVTKTQVGLGNVQNTDLTSAVNLNTAKVGITPAQASDITTNNSKITYPSVDSTKVGFISVTQAVNLDTIESDTATNNAKVSDINHVTLELPNVDNTSDVDKPVSTAQSTAIGVVQTDINNHEADLANPHAVTQTQVGLGNVDNTSDANKPISTATQTALDLKVDTTDATLTTANIFKSVSLTMDFSDRVVADSGTVESRNCVMNEYLKILN